MPADSSSTSTGVSSKSVVIGTAGHIDHGKTALIRALTGVDTDRLPEEKRRGITVDLGFASLNFEAADNSQTQLSFIDVPGHALFVRNMLAGAGGIDAVLLVISAEEGVKPQTEEHLSICTMLGIERGITVITKIDAVGGERLDEVCRTTQHFLSGTFLARAPIIPVSAFVGTGIEPLRHELASLAARIPPRDGYALPRIPVDRAFVMKGFGTIVTGTMIAGSLKIGQTVAIEPGTRVARIRGIQTHGRTEDAAHAGSRVALNLAGIEASDLKRGDTLVEPSTISAVDAIDVELDLLPHAAALKHRARVHFHEFASECMAAVSVYGYQPVAPGNRRLARLRLSKPVVLLPGDRFVLRHGTPVSTIGGGRVLDAHPLPRLRKAASHAWLAQIAEASAIQRIHLRIARRGMAGITLHGLSRETGTKPDAILRLLKPLIEEEKLLCLPGDLLLTREAIDECVALVIHIVENCARESSSDGLKRSELKSNSRLGAEVFDFALKRLEADKKVRTQSELVFAFGHDRSDPDQAQLSAVLSAYEAAGLATPSPEELSARMAIPPEEMRRLITLLLREKRLVKLGSDAMFFHSQALTDLAQKIRSRCGEKIDIARFKELTGLSRKYAIPLLEYLDRQRVTRKQDDHRIVL
jgi:selenocysteine-specific elongation factor